MIPTRTRSRRKWKPEQISNQPNNIQNTENIKVGDDLIRRWPPGDSASQLVARRTFYGTSSRRHLWRIWRWWIVGVCRIGGRGWRERWFTLGGTALPHGDAELKRAVTRFQCFRDCLVWMSWATEFSSVCSNRNFILTESDLGDVIVRDNRERFPFLSTFS